MACRKYRYRDAIAAKLALATVTWQDKSWRPNCENRVYWCPRCRGWHLTSQARRRAD